MWIIFDLDDTLVDASGTFGQLRLAAALQAMKEAGLGKGELEKLKEIDKRSNSGKEALENFLAELNADEFLKIGSDKYYNYGEKDISCINCFPGVKEMLHKLVSEHNLALVTYGNEQQQLLKLKIVGIDQGLFKKIIVTPVPEKGICYQQLMEEFELMNKDIVVCGDREGDLRPAKNLGLTTVHVRQGRGKVLNPEEWDYSLSSVIEIEEVVEEVIKKL